MGDGLQIGDWCTWVSQGSGSSLRKVGHVIAVVPPAEGRRRPLRSWIPKDTLAIITSVEGWQTDETRYLVEVPQTSKATGSALRPVIYTPRPHLVERCEAPATKPPALSRQLQAVLHVVLTIDGPVTTMAVARALGLARNTAKKRLMALSKAGYLARTRRTDVTYRVAGDEQESAERVLAERDAMRDLLCHWRWWERGDGGMLRTSSRRQLMRKRDRLLTAIEHGGELPPTPEPA